MIKMTFINKYLWLYCFIVNYIKYAAMEFAWWLSGKESACNAGDSGSIPGSGRSPGEGSGNPLQYSCLGNPMDRGAWWATVHGVAKSRTRLSDFAFTFHFLAMEKEMATHSRVLAWRIPGKGEPGRLPSMGLHRIGHDLAAASWRYGLPRWC